MLLNPEQLGDQREFKNYMDEQFLERLREETVERIYCKCGARLAAKVDVDYYFKPFIDVSPCPRCERKEP